MSIEKIEADLREALSGLTQLEMASRGMIPVSRAMVEAHEAYTKLCGDRENIRAILDELSRLREVERRAMELVRRWVSWCDDWHPGKSHPFDDIEAAKAFLSEREGQE